MTSSANSNNGKVSHLARIFQAGHFAVCAEISPPVGPNIGYIQRQIDELRGYADAFNVTANQSAMVHMASLPVSIMLKQAGLDPVFQITCRDHNRLPRLWRLSSVPEVGQLPCRQTCDLWMPCRRWSSRSRKSLALSISWSTMPGSHATGCLLACLRTTGRL